MTKRWEMLEEVLKGYGLSPTIAYALRFFLRNPYESLIIVDDQAKIQFMDRGTEKFFGLAPGGAKGRDIREFVPQSGLPLVLETKKPMIGRIFEFHGKERIGSLYPLLHEGKVVGAVGRLLFQSLEEVERINREIRELKREITYLKEKELYELSARYSFENILGESTLMRDAVYLAKRIAMINTDVLITGESGTGKELFAHSIHGYAHINKPFIKVNCPAIPFELAESELFGYEKGAFSGALASGKPGKFEAAQGGTIFLDEVSSLPLSIQAKLLRVVQEREVERLGATKPKRVEFRVIAATNTDLKELVKEGKFREDLYYRLAKAVITIPPLRERREDIPLYIAHYLERINRSFGTKVKGLSPAAKETLINYSWPGNVRELINVLEQALLRAWEAEEILLEHLPLELRTERQEDSSLFRDKMAQTEREMIRSALEKAGGQKTKAARLLKIPRSTLYMKIKRYGL